MRGLSEGGRRGKHNIVCVFLVDLLSLGRSPEGGGVSRRSPAPEGRETQKKWGLEGRGHTRC